MVALRDYSRGTPCTSHGIAAVKVQQLQVAKWRFLLQNPIQARHGGAAYPPLPLSTNAGAWRGELSSHKMLGDATLT